MAGNGGETFLPALAKSFDKINDEQTVNTADFAAACERILPIFDHLGRHNTVQPSSPEERRTLICSIGHAHRLFVFMNFIPNVTLSSSRDVALY